MLGLITDSSGRAVNNIHAGRCPLVRCFTITINDRGFHVIGMGIPRVTGYGAGKGTDISISNYDGLWCNAATLYFKFTKLVIQQSF